MVGLLDVACNDKVIVWTGCIKALDHIANLVQKITPHTPGHQVVLATRTF